MTRTRITIAAAFATLTGCAEGFDQVDGQGLLDHSFAGIDRSLPITPMNDDPVDGGPSNSDWSPADLPAGTYWMTIEEIAEVGGESQMEEGMRQLAYVTAVDGVPMLHGMAPIMANGDQLSAEQIDVYTAPIEDGRCKITTGLSALGRQTGPDAFDMFVYFEDRVTGEDCEKLGLGSEKSEFAAFQAGFRFIPPIIAAPVGDDPAEGGNPGDGGNVGGGPNG